MSLILPAPGIIVPPTWRGADMLYVAKKLGLSAGLKLCLDAGDVASYPGSGQSWLDTAGGGYDFFRGATVSATTDDPTFNGNAGGRSSAEFWSFDGGDKLRYDSPNETWMDALHKAAATYTWVCWANMSDVGNAFGLWGTNGGNQAVGTGANASFNAGHVHARSVNATVTVLDATAIGTIIVSTWQMWSISLDVPNLRMIDGMNAAFNSQAITYPSPSAAAASQVMEIGARGNASSPIASGSKIASFMMWNVPLTAAQLAAIFNATRGRFGV